MFNLIDPETISELRFPIWLRSTKHSATEWGCGESNEVSKILDASVGASVEASGGFFGFFQAKVETSGEAATTTVYKKVLKDPQYRHRITYWDLLEGMDSPDKLISPS